MSSQALLPTGRFECSHWLNLAVSNRVSVLRFSPDGSLLAVVDDEDPSNVGIFSTADWQKPARFRMKFQVREMLWNPLVPRRFLVAGSNGSIEIFRVDAQDITKPLQSVGNFNFMDLTRVGPLEYVALDAEASELSAICQGSLCTYGYPFNQERFSYVSRVDMPPSGDLTLTAYDPLEVVSIAYIGRKNVAIGFNAGILVVSTCVPTQILRKLDVPPLFQHTIHHVAPSVFGHRIIALTERTGYDVYHSPEGFISNTKPVAHSWVPAVVTTRGEVHTALATSAFLPDDPDGLVRTQGGPYTEAINSTIENHEQRPLVAAATLVTLFALPLLAPQNYRDRWQAAIERSTTLVPGGNIQSRSPSPPDSILSNGDEAVVVETGLVVYPDPPSPVTTLEGLEELMEVLRERDERAWRGCQEASSGSSSLEGGGDSLLDSPPPMSAITEGPISQTCSNPADVSSSMGVQRDLGDGLAPDGE
ncbi:hypothetical protein NLJ89_g9024 [Agrocybe chaxingu]|uniref:Uncharacterized protein n=1 Tax=Agrocybe chaxingu TaxID=84603 RepID=A0A9W8MS83_9AGAR|nr:hypothetical protein NLJ89_g9024 [Agrocybe chaxingu]